MIQVQFQGAVCLNALPMFHPLSVYVGLRYVRARSHKFFVSFITWASLVGVCVGVAALIVILSVMNGFESELRDRLLSLSAQAHASRGRSPPVTVEQALQQRLQALPGVTDVSPYAELQALAVRSRRCCRCCCAASIRRGAARADLGPLITQGQLADLVPGARGHRRGYRRAARLAASGTP